MYIYIFIFISFTFCMYTCAQYCPKTLSQASHKEIDKHTIPIKSDKGGFHLGSTHKSIYFL